jgi:short-subunit dehydrogenase
MMPPRGRIVLTGASGGLGAAFALALAPHASHIVLAGRDGARLEALCTILQARHGTPAAFVAGDVTDPAVRAAIVDVARGPADPLDLLVNAAGINDFHAFEAQAPQSVERLIAVNLVAPMLLTQAMLPLMERARRAQVINVGSIFGYLGYPGFAVYCAAKFGLRGFSQALRRELAGTCIEVRYFAPRATRTPLNDGSVKALNRELGTREDAPERVAAALVRFIARRNWDARLGMPERLFVFLNRLAPSITDKAIGGQLAVIRKHLPGLRRRDMQTEGVKP